MSSDQIDTVIERDASESPDFIIGIPSLNEGDTITNVAEMMSKGIREAYPDRSANIINVDNASTDDTREKFLSADTGRHGKKYISTAPGKKGKGRNFYNLFHEVVQTEPDAVAVVDADLTSVEISWARQMLGNILNGYDLVTPIYKRHQYDGTITNHLCFPITYGINGRNIRQPIGGDFAFSTAAARNWLDRHWEESTFQYGVDIFMTTTTLYEGLDICSARLGRKDHDPSAPNLKPMFKEVANTLFALLRDNRETWEQVEQVRDVDSFGSNEGYETPELDTDLEGLTDDVIDLFNQEKGKIQSFLPDDLFGDLEEMIDERTMDLDARQWSQVLFSAIAGYIQEPDHDIIEGMLPLYMFRNASFQTQTSALSPDECQKRIREQADLFFENRSDLIRRIEDHSARHSATGV